MTLLIGQAIQLGVDEDLDRLDVEVLLGFVLTKARTYLFAFPEVSLTAVQEDKFTALVARRKIGEPVAYLVEQREFWSLPIKTNSSTLIPRPDTEVLVETVLQQVEKEIINCVDLGTGTGAIALALKSERPSWRVEGIDRIFDAVELATQNATALKLEVAFRQGSWCEGLASKSIDVLVSNPPYIDKDDPHLKQGDVRHEPLSALIADDQGFADIKLIISQAQNCLAEGGSLFFEHGWQQAGEVRRLLTISGFIKVETIQDYAGHDRVTFGFLENQEH